MVVERRKYCSNSALKRASFVRAYVDIIFQSQISATGFPAQVKPFGAVIVIDQILYSRNIFSQAFYRLFTLLIHEKARVT